MDGGLQFENTLRFQKVYLLGADYPMIDLMFVEMTGKIAGNESRGPQDNCTLRFYRRGMAMLEHDEPKRVD
jgi:hypothetical protein